MAGISVWNNHGHAFARIETRDGEYRLVCNSTEKELCKTTDFEYLSSQVTKLKWEYDNVK